jgi:hypothetical protein
MPGACPPARSGRRARFSERCGSAGPFDLVQRLPGWPLGAGLPCNRVLAGRRAVKASAARRSPLHSKGCRGSGGGRRVARRRKRTRYGQREPAQATRRATHAVALTALRRGSAPVALRYSITSSARASSKGGKVIPSAAAVLALTKQLKLGWLADKRRLWAADSVFGRVSCFGGRPI